MFRSRRNKYPDLGEHAIFGNEEAAAIRADLADVVARVDELTERINAQFTSISAYAEISRVQLAEVREEARSDMERSRDMLVGLIDRLRDELRADSTRELGDGQHTDTTATAGAALPPQPTGREYEERLERRITTVEHTIDDTIAALERSEQRQRKLAETMTSFIDTMLSQHMGANLDAAANDAADPSDESDGESPIRLTFA